MKKFITLLFLSIFTILNANAQWSDDIVIDADELIGTPEQKICYYTTQTNPKAGLIFSQTDNILCITLGSGIIDYKTLSGLKTVDIKIGFYVTENGKEKLQDKATITFRVTDSRTCGINGDNYNKIFNHLKTKGSVRFIIPMYLSSDLDFTVSKKRKPRIGVDM